MIHTIRHARLKTGERLRVAALVAPAGRYAARIREFLSHKGQPWLMHVDMANEGRTDDLRTTYTIGLLRGQIVGNVMIVDDGRVGILGHVFTAPRHRRKGVCRQLMAGAVGRFKARGGRILTLGTGFDSPAYWIYHSFGFRGIEPGSGQMLFEAAPGAAAEHFAPSRTRVADLRWEHWPGLSLLYLQPEGDRVRAYAHGVVGRQHFEGGFLALKSQWQRADVRAKVLVSRRGAVVGAAIVQRDLRWPGAVYLLDVFVHPNFRGGETRLLRSLRFPRGAKVQAYLDAPSRERVRALREAGFAREAVLRNQVADGADKRHALVYALAT